MHPKEDDMSSTTLEPPVPTMQESLEQATGAPVSSHIPPPAPHQPLLSEFDVQDTPNHLQWTFNSQALVPVYLYLTACKPLFYKPGPTTMTVQDTPKNLCSKLRRQPWKSEQQPKPLFRLLQTAFRESLKTGGCGTSASNVGISGHGKEVEDIRHSHRELNNIKQGPALPQLVTSKMIVERPLSQETSYEDQVHTSENTIEKAAQQDRALLMIRQAKSRTLWHKILPKLTVVDSSFFITPCKFFTMA
ncbi:hypothetical protein HPB51_005114 [Rhipicephalus microplus]|uniref:Uncharacterized protein n=1 Tax=Rhipicephalus microplus TaxID=6941 RepID=A0A9J6EM19_RHIMP|nr:hypothetical protein HPB51_005114 [Rhipicephalus microplus]